jgi:hypothetical protein
LKHPNASLWRKQTPWQAPQYQSLQKTKITISKSQPLHSSTCPQLHDRKRRAIPGAREYFAHSLRNAPAPASWTAQAAVSRNKTAASYQYLLF